MAARITTVTGPIPPERIGFTLPHEHTSCRPELAPTRSELTDFTFDAELMTGELHDFRRRGGSCVVDLTSVGLGRDPVWLRNLATRSGVYLVMGAGWYRESFYPPEAGIDRRTVDELADTIVAEFEHGVDGTGIRPGIIGEIGTEHAWVSPREERVHRAVARAARETGLAIVTHSLRSHVGLAQLRIFEEEGADPERVVIGHADSVLEIDYHLALLDRGASLCFDLLGRPGEYAAAYEAQLVELIVELLERGFANRILLSHDVCSNAQLRAYAGTGFSYLAQHFLPHLRTAAVGEGEIATMTIDNPRRILTVA
ncbi:MAG TPA: phosphotriesterase-related protein [Candidatus Limnocylindria bacterium]|nr:phosphotriesterase-related protein [Candidatus Limnocylindria bacterium]